MALPAGRRGVAALVVALAQVGPLAVAGSSKGGGDQYEKNNKITAFYSSMCNARIIWGGNESIKNIRTF